MSKKLVNKNEMIVYEMNQLDIDRLGAEQIVVLAGNIISNLDIKKLEETVLNTVLKLSCVSEPSFGSPVYEIATDNQERLQIIWKLTHNLTMIKSFTHNFRYNKGKCRDNYDQIYSYVLEIKSLVDSIKSYATYTQEEKEKEQLYLDSLKGQNDKLQEYNFKLLGEGD